MRYTLRTLTSLTLSLSHISHPLTSLTLSHLSPSHISHFSNILWSILSSFTPICWARW